MRASHASVAAPSSENCANKTPSKKTFKEKRPMILDRDKAAEAAAERTPHELAKLICKLRWIGMEEEADRLLSELAQRCTSADDHVFETTRETD
jgi:hypothetical protein